jgi:caffeyl-CoA reductase-Etf complex subunit CarE
MLIIDSKACTGCSLCVKNCPFGAMLIVDEVAAAQDNCTLCGACMNTCGEHAITIERAAASPEELAKFKGVFIWAECDESEDGERLVPKKVTLELLGVAQGLAGTLGEEIKVLVLGDGRPVETDALFAHGADAIIRHENKLLWPYSTDAYTTVISGMIAAKKPSIFLLGATPNGRDLAPRVGARLKLGLTADCTMLEINDDKQLVQTRPAFGGNIMASILTPFSRPQMATVRPNVFPVGDPDTKRKGPIEDFDVTLTRGVIRTRILDIEKITSGGEGIENASVIVAGGTGLQAPENMGMLKELADELGGTVAGSRPLVEAGWIPHTMQVGQSGTTVSPDLYIAVGISGAVQHTVGMNSARTIIAINNDPEAPIFKVADVGIVGDAFEVVPAMIKEIRDAKKAA